MGSSDVPDQVVQGDINCDGIVDAQDALGALRHAGGLPVDQQQPCFAPGAIAAIPGPSGVPGPSGAPGPAGINLFANISASGAVLSGSATGATVIGEGGYLVTFDRDVSSCAALAVAGPTGQGDAATDNAVASVAVGVQDRPPQEVNVFFSVPSNPQLEGRFTDFHLIVAC
jgi:hypothetical protein